MNKASLVILAAGWGLSILNGCDRIETVEDVFPTYQSAVADKNSGWLPLWVPASAKDIRRRRNIDSNELWMSFIFASSDIKQITKECEKVAIPRDIDFPRALPASWWPKELVKDARGDLNSFSVHKCRSGGSVALDIQHNVAYYWEIYPEWMYPKRKTGAGTETK
jgi:hypothetical protein